MPCDNTSLRRPLPINLREDLFRPNDGVRDGTNCRGDLRSCWILRQLPRREDGGGDQQHALAPLIHAEDCTTFRLVFALALDSSPQVNPFFVAQVD